MTRERPAWTVLLLGGPSGVGKTSAAARLGRRLGIAWLQVDDLRLALQYSRAALPERTHDLYFFLDRPDVWQQPPERLRDGLIAVGDVLQPAIEVVIEHHCATAARLVVEGDGILPSLLERPAIRQRAGAGQVRAVFVVESDEQAMLNAMLARDRGLGKATEAELRVQARMNWLYGQWLAAEAGRLGPPALESRPWTTLPERILGAAS